MELHQVLGRLAQEEGSVADRVFFKSKLSWSWPCRHRALAVVPSCPSWSPTRPPALQPQSARIICLHHATPRHADAQGLAACEKRWRNEAAKERAKAGLGNIWNSIAQHHPNFTYIYHPVIKYELQDTSSCIPSELNLHFGSGRFSEPATFDDSGGYKVRLPHKLP